MFDYPVKIICLRLNFIDGKWNINNSLVLNVKVNIKKNISEIDDWTMEKWVGWEKNDKGKLSPQMANLKQYMDPVTYVFRHDAIIMIIIIRNLHLKQND